MYARLAARFSKGAWPTPILTTHSSTRRAWISFGEIREPVRLRQPSPRATSWKIWRRHWRRFGSSLLIQQEKSWGKRNGQKAKQCFGRFDRDHITRTLVGGGTTRAGNVSCFASSFDCGSGAASRASESGNQCHAECNQSVCIGRSVPDLSGIFDRGVCLRNQVQKAELEYQNIR